LESQEETVMSSPANRTALREENRPAQPAGHGQRGRRLRLPGRGQAAGGGRAQRLEITAAGAQRAIGQGRGALAEEHRVDALHPGGVLGAQVVVGLRQSPAVQDAGRRDPALRQPALGQQLPQVARADLAGPGVPLAAAVRRGVGRLGQVRRDPGRGQLLGDVSTSPVSVSR
jgi:hypothetical protein